MTDREPSRTVVDAACPAIRGGEPGPAEVLEGARLRDALADVAAGARDRDAEPGFPHSALGRLADAGALGVTVSSDGSRAASFADEWSVVRTVARADGSVGRILDGHLNAVERLQVEDDEALRADVLAAASGELLLGVWGADPAPGEGEPARVGADGRRIDGAKVFCSGAGGLDRALVQARDEQGSPPLLAYVDLAHGIEVDRDWYRGAGMRASESHRVLFDGARVIRLLGAPGQLAAEPWFSRDGIRTAATWAGVAESAVAAALDELSARGEPSDLEALAAGRMRASLGTIDAWFEHAARLADADGSRPLVDVSIALRSAVSDACRALLDEAARSAGSRPLARGGALDRATRDLGVFLLQHRLDPLLARAGRRAIEERA